MGRLLKIKDRVVRIGFPELSAVQINVKKKKKGKADYFAAMQYVEDKVYDLLVGKALRGAPRTVVEGCFAHELAHISFDVRRNPLQRGLDQVLCDSSEAYQTFDERRTDELVIIRGYGPQLLSFVEFANERYKKYNKKDGLTAKEIKAKLRVRGER